MDKKINQLDDAGMLSANDYIPLNQDHATGKALKATLQALRKFVLGDSLGGARIYFGVGVPSAEMGVSGDVSFDIQGKGIYQKMGDNWQLMDYYGVSGGVGQIRFTSSYGMDGLSGDGNEYINTDLIEATVQDVRVEADPLIRVVNHEDAPSFDEWDNFPIDGKIVFGAPLPEGRRITIMYSL